MSDIRGDKAKTQAYCQINSLGAQMVEAAQEKDSKKAEALFQRVDDLEKQLGPQYHALFDALYDADPDFKDVQDILSMFNKLDESVRSNSIKKCRWQKSSSTDFAEGL